MSYADFQNSPLGVRIAPIIRNPGVIGRMEALSREGQPAVIAVDGPLGELGASLTDTQKQHVGRLVRDVLADRGWRPAGKKRLAKGRIFASGSIYRKIGPVETEAVQFDAPSGRARMAKAQALVRKLPTHPGSVDDFLAEKRRDAARED